MKRHVTLIAATLSFVLAQAAVRSADWPQWRGPNRVGVAVGARLPAKWPEKLPAPKWRSFVGIGYSAPCVAGGQVFIQGREGGSEMCLSFDAETGSPLWKQSYPSSFEPPDPTAGKGPNSVPTFDRDRVYMLGLGGMFHCIEAKTGRILWKHDFAKEYWGVEKDSTGDEAWRPVCGASASALVDGDQVIIPVGGKKAGAFTAFDRITGRLLWRALDDRSSYASPMPANLAGTRQIVGFTGRRMVGLDHASHALLWEFPFTAMFEQTIITPVLWKDRVIICGEVKPATALDITREGGKLTQKEAWKNADLSAYLVTPVIVKDHVIGFDQRARRLVCIDLASGKTAWTSPRIGRLFVSLVVAVEQVLALSDFGELTLLAADTKEYKLLGSWKVAEPGTIWSQLAVAGNRLYIKDKEHLTCYELAG